MCTETDTKSSTMSKPQQTKSSSQGKTAGGGSIGTYDNFENVLSKKSLLEEEDDEDDVDLEDEQQEALHNAMKNTSIVLNEFDTRDIEPDRHPATTANGSNYDRQNDNHLDDDFASHPNNSNGDGNGDSNFFSSFQDPILCSNDALCHRSGPLHFSDPLDLMTVRPII